MLANFILSFKYSWTEEKNRTFNKNAAKMLVDWISWKNMQRMQVKIKRNVVREKVAKFQLILKNTKTEKKYLNEAAVEWIWQIC